MRRRIAVCVLGLMAVVLVLAACTLTPSGTIHGRIIGGETGKPLEGAQIILCRVLEESGKGETCVLQGHESCWIYEVLLSSDGQTVVSAAETLKVWDLPTGEVIRTLTGHSAGVTSMAVTPDLRRAVSSGYGGDVTVWDLSQGREERTLAGHRDRVSDVALSPDGRRAVSVGFDGMLKLWHVDSGEELASVNLEHKLKCVSLTPDGTRILVADAAGNLTCFSLS